MIWLFEQEKTGHTDCLTLLPRASSMPQDRKSVGNQFMLPHGSLWMYPLLPNLGHGYLERFNAHVYRFRVGCLRHEAGRFLVGAPTAFWTRRTCSY